MKATFQYTMLLLLQQAFVPLAAFQSRIITRPTTKTISITTNDNIVDQRQQLFTSTAKTTTTQRMLSPMDISEMVTSAAAAAASLSSSSSSSMWISTIDSDIANIPQNEFATIFTGGLVVMSGGLLSALIVGFILESRNLYASVVVDSYVDNDSLEDEEFWKSLSEEEQKKTRQVLDKIKQQKQGLGGGGDATSTVAVVVDKPSKKTTSVITTTAEESALGAAAEMAPAVAKEDSTKVNKKMDMFSDYGD